MEEAALCEKEVVKGRENLREKLLEETLIDLHSKRMEGLLPDPLCVDR